MGSAIVQRGDHAASCQKFEFYFGSIATYDQPAIGLTQVNARIVTWQLWVQAVSKPKNTKRDENDILKFDVEIE